MDDRARRYWLTRFSDVEIASIATGMFGRTILPEVIHLRRETLLGTASDDDEV